MNDVKFLSIIKKWCVPIALLSVALCYLFSQYIENKQTYTASAIIEYTNPGAKDGIAPSGDAIDVSLISASNVIADAIRELDLNVSIDFVRSRLFVKSIIPEDDQIIIDALLEKGEEYAYFPTSYLVSFRVGSSYSEEFARRILEAIFRSYLNYYAEKFIDVTITPNNVGNTANVYFDYIESVELIKTGLDEIINFLKARAEAYPFFYCSSNGYSFSNLCDRYIELRELEVYKLTARILDDRVARDSEALVKKYEHRISLENDAITAYRKELDEVKSLIDSYSAKSIEVWNDGDEEIRKSGAAVTNFVDDQNAEMKTIYDRLMDKYVEYSIALEMSKKNVEQYAARREVFAAADQTASGDQARADVEGRIHAVTRASNDLYAMLIEMMSEFNEYRSTQSVSVKSTIDVTRGINTSLYTTVALAFFIIVGVIGTVVIARFGEMYRYYRYVDPKTDIPNRLSCDNEIERLGKQPLGEHVCCVSISLTSLVNLNAQEGRKPGDIMLKNFGMMLKYCATKYGFVGYNGGPNFMCVFEDCRMEKAQTFISTLNTAIENYNRRYPEMPISIRLSVCESGHESLYNIRDLLKRSIALLYDEGASKAAGEKKNEK